MKFVLHFLFMIGLCILPYYGEGYTTEFIRNNTVGIMVYSFLISGPLYTLIAVLNSKYAKPESVFNKKVVFLSIFWVAFLCVLLTNSINHM
jgi:uncharacterized BrkB/YihY/UPF0761 family membrane protein